MTQSFPLAPPAPSARPPGGDGRQVVVFGHIPKTAGSTFKTILWRQYRTREVFFSMHPDRHADRFARLGQALADGTSPVRVVVTHAGYGVHDLLPAGNDYPAITFLREPIDRVISGYYMFLRQGKIPPDLSLEDFVRTVPKPGWNMQTSFLSGYFLACHLEGRQPDAAAFDAAMLDRAKENLARHAVVGLTERFDETLLLLRETFGWERRNLLYYRTNVGRNRKPRRQVSDEALAVVREHNALDLELYAFARRLFEERVAARPGLADRLRRFRTANRCYAAVAPHLEPVARPLVRPLRRVLGRGGA